MINSLFQLVLFTGLVWFVSFMAQTAITKLAFKLNGWPLYLLMSSVGVAFHELSHAIVAVIFGHKVNKIALFAPDIRSGTLGYVNHAYNPLNIYHRIGCFFIGFAPLYLAPASIYLLSYILLPQPEHLIKSISFLGTLTIPEIASQYSIFYDYFLNAYKVDPINMFVWLFSACSIALSCGPSPSDVKNSLSGVIFVFIALFVLPTLFSFNFPSIIVGGSYILLILCVLQIITLLTLIVFWTLGKKTISLLLHKKEIM